MPVLPRELISSVRVEDDASRVSLHLETGEHVTDRSEARRVRLPVHDIGAIEDRMALRAPRTPAEQEPQRNGKTDGIGSDERSRFINDQRRHDKRSRTDEYQ